MFFSSTGYSAKTDDEKVTVTGKVVMEARDKVNNPTAVAIIVTVFSSFVTDKEFGYQIRIEGYYSVLI